MVAIKPVFTYVASVDPLKRFLHGETQKLSECLNSVIWTRIPKTVFVRLETLKFGVYDAVLCFTGGVARKSDVLNMLGVRSGSNTVNALKQIDIERIWKAETAKLDRSREARKSKRAQKRRKEAQEGPDGPE
jgi:hypothetical protein